MRASVADELRSLILRRQLQPGERLRQTELAEQLGVSRTPIREALQDLASEGLVEISPYKGASVSELSLDDLEEVYSVRSALEGYAASLAAQHITEEELQKLESILSEMEDAIEQGELTNLMELNRQFNSTIYASSRQTLLYEQAMKFMDLANLYRRIHFSVDRLAADALAEHRVLLAALRNRDAEEVERLTRKEAKRSVSALRALFEGGKLPSLADTIARGR